MKKEISIKISTRSNSLLRLIEVKLCFLNLTIDLFGICL
jgi:hypothetical protein